jgi:hypothetical protein
MEAADAFETLVTTCITTCYHNLKLFRCSHLHENYRPLHSKQGQDCTVKQIRHQIDPLRDS